MLCQSCVLACEMETLEISNLQELPSEKKPKRRVRMTFARGTPWVWKCQQCASSPCAEACVSGSLIPGHDNGRVEHHPENCVGCGSCMLVCPYDALWYDDNEKKVSKCNLCPDRETPPCVEACQSKALVFQKLNAFVHMKRKRMIAKIGQSHDTT